MLNEKLKYREFYIYCALILMLTINACLGFLTSQQVAFADYQDVLDDPNAILNFNQLNSVVDTNTHVHSSGNAEGDFYYINQDPFFSFTPNSSHRYYIYGKLTNYTSNIASVGIYFNNNSFAIDFDINVNSYYIVENISNISLWRIYKTNTNNGDFYFQVNFIDLTAMFGENNDNLTLYQCRDLFIADYYQYNTGTPLSFDTIQAYNNGVNAYVSNTQLHLSTSKFINSVYSVNVNNDFLGYGTLSGVQYDVLEKHDTYIALLGGEINSITGAQGTICLPFVTEISANTQITITGQAACSQYNEAVHVGFYYYINGVMQDIGDFVCGTQSRYKNNTITFTTPFALDRIYIACDYDVYLRDVQVGYYVTNIQLLQDSSYENGYAKAEEYYKAYYSSGGAGYQAIYNAGYYAYPTDDHFTFQSLIASAVDVPVQAFINLFDFEILGINMKTLYASLLTLLVIVCIVRLVL